MTDVVPKTFVPQDEIYLLFGKHTGHMYFYPGHCAYCGERQPSDGQFNFCSYECQQKAMRTFLDAVLDEFTQKTFRMSWPHYRAAYTAENDCPPIIPNELETRALQRYVETWEKERDRSLVQERQTQRRMVEDMVRKREETERKEKERTTTLQQKQAEKDAVEAAKQEAKRLEEERWKPRPFKL